MTKASKLIYQKADSYSKLAKKLGYRSRSSLKLVEILEKDSFLKSGSFVLDLGSSPGGWSQVAQKKVGKRGVIFGVDPKPMEPILGVTFIQKKIKDLTENDFKIKGKKIDSFNIVFSDIAPNISGISSRDDALMVRLLENVKIIINSFLEPNGVTLVKAFQGESLDNMMIYMKSRFQKVRIRKPASSRANSREVYILGMKKINE